MYADAKVLNYSIEIYYHAMPFFFFLYYYFFFSVSCQVTDFVDNDLWRRRRDEKMAS